MLDKLNDPLELQYELLPSDYGHAMVFLWADNAAHAKKGLLDIFLDFLWDVFEGKWALRLLAFIALVAASIWLSLVIGFATPLGLTALLAIPVGIFLWIKIERFFAKLSRKIDSTTDGLAVKEVTKYIESGAIKVPLGPSRFTADSKGIRVEYLAPSDRGTPRELPWSSIQIMMFGQKAGLISPSLIKDRKDIQQAVVIPLERLPDSQSIVQSLQALRGD